MGPVLAEIAFDGAIIEWRGPAPFHFIAIPPDQVGEIHYAARHASYGWGCVPVEASINGVAFRTSLFPKDGAYLVPLKASVRRETGLAPGNVARLELRVMVRSRSTDRNG